MSYTLASTAAVVQAIAIIVLVLLIVLWPTIYALIRRRWSRAIIYFGLTLPLIWIELNRAQWWGPTDPENDFSPLKNSFLYTYVNWVVLTAILWTITAFSDLLLANNELRTQE